MSGLDLIALLEKKELLSARQVDKLRQQIEDSPKSVSAGTLAKLLVKKDLLTERLAQKLLAQLKQKQAESAIGLTAAPAVVPKPPPVDDDDELGLAEIEEDKEEPKYDEPVAELEDLEAVTLDSVSEEKSDDDVPLVQDDDPLDLDAADDDVVQDLLGATPGREDEVDEGVTIVRRRSGISGWFDRSRGKVPRKKIRANRWDSPLLLVGGGALLLMVFMALGLWFYLTRGTGDDRYAQALDFYRKQSYGQAIDAFDSFLDDYPDHPKVSDATVRIGMARIWSVVDGKRWEDALTTARAELPKIEGQEAFSDARQELATVLPEIMEGFADDAMAAADIAGAEKFLELANEAFEEVSNSSYLPTSVRQGVQPRIEEIETKLAAVKHRINQDRELEATVESILAAADGGQIAMAYDHRKALLLKYPGLEVDARLVDAVRSVTEKERDSVARLTELPQPTTEDHAVASQFQVTLANRRGDAVPSMNGRVVYIQAQGAVYGLNAETGEVLWRRHVGIENPFHPVPPSSTAGSDAIISDSRREELLRLNATSGELVWRLPFGQSITAPVLAEGQIYVAFGDDAQGRLVDIDSETGKVNSGVSFPTGVDVGPAVDLERNLAVQPGSHSSVYVLNAEQWTCQGVYYLGHAKGAISVPPVLLQGHVLIAENPGPDFSNIHVLAPDAESGGLRSVVEPLRLKGRVVVPMIPFGRRLLITTDRGQIHVFEVDPNAPRQIVRQTAAVSVSVRPGTVSFPLFSNGRLWVGDSQLSKYELQTSRGQLAQKWINSKNDAFVAPLQRQASVLFHARKRVNRLGVTVAAVNINDRGGTPRDGSTIWETDLGVPPAGEPFINRAAQEINVVSGNGALFALGTSAIRAGIVDKPKSEVIDRDLPTLRHSMTLPAARAAFFGDPISARMLLFDPAAQSKLTRSVSLDLQSGAPAALPVVFNDSLLVCSREGPVYVLNEQTGKSRMHPFQPPLQPGASVDWLQAAVTMDGESVIVGDGQGRLFQLGIQSEPSPQLVPEAQAQTELKLVAPLAVLGNTLFSAARSVGADQIVSFDTAQLKSVGQWDVSGNVIWGPIQIDDQILVATDANELVCLDEQDVKWRAELPYGPLAGHPMVSNGKLIFTSVRGMVWQLDRQTGNELLQVDVGESLGTGPVAFAGNRLLVCGGDGTVHIVTLPSSE